MAKHFVAINQPGAEGVNQQGMLTQA